MKHHAYNLEKNQFSGGYMAIEEDVFSLIHG